MRAYPSLSPYSAASLATELCAIERVQRRHAERCCSGEDGGYTRPTRKLVQGVAVCDVEHDPEAEERAGRRVAKQADRWRDRLCTLAVPNTGSDGYEHAQRMAAVNDGVRLLFEGDPRGPVLCVQFPGEPEAVAV